MHLLHLVHPSLVSIHRLASAESFSAFFAFHRFQFRVLTAVILEGAFGGKSRRADRTLEGPILDMTLFVLFALGFCHERGWAVRTLELAFLFVYLGNMITHPSPSKVMLRAMPAFVKAGTFVIVCPLPKHVLRQG